MRGVPINDSGFWIVTKYLGLSVADGLKTWTVITTAGNLVGFGVTSAPVARRLTGFRQPDPTTETGRPSGGRFRVPAGGVRLTKGWRARARGVRVLRGRHLRGECR